MPTFRAFAYNTGSTISGTEQVGLIAVGTTTLGGNVVWWAGPDEDLGYVIAESVSGGTMTGANGQQAFLGFYRSTTKTDNSFISLANYLSYGSQNFTTGSAAKIWLNNNGYWTSYVSATLPIISANRGDNVSYINNTGKLFTWGYGYGGRNAYNSTQDSYTPKSICGGVKTFCQVALGDNNGFAIDKNGKIWSWGYGGGGALGNNGISNFSTPVSIVGANKTFCSVSAELTQVALDKYGQVWGWGYNFRGQLGNNSTISRMTPVSICGSKKTFCKIEGAYERVMAIDQYGQVWGWGSNTSGEIGNRSAVSYSTPVSICGAKKTFCQISGTLSVSLGLDKNGQVWSWGNTIHGNNQILAAYSTPVSVCGAVKTFCQISRGGVSVAIDKNGQIWTWGTSNRGLLGNNILCNNSVLTPIQISGSKKTFCSVSAGLTNAIAVDYSGILWTWGSNLRGQLGINNTNIVYSPKSISGNKKTFCTINASFTTFFGIQNNGRLWGWGYNFAGGLGDRSTANRLTPVSVCGAVKTFCNVYNGSQFTLGIDKNGRLWAWGQNNRGQLGDNSLTVNSTPISVLGATKTFCKIVADFETSNAIDQYGQVWGWGIATGGLLGDNSQVSQRTPKSVCGVRKTFCQITTASGALTLDKYGRIWGWGYGSSGRLGTNSVTNFSTPVSVCGAIKTFCSIAKGTTSTAIDQYGQVWVWGLGTGGLGDNSASNRSTPVSICGVKKTFCQISSYSHKLAIDKYGKIWGWGTNTLGQLGDGTTINRSTPVSVLGGNKTFCKVVTWQNGSGAVDQYGQIWTWGESNLAGTLGQNTTNFIATPVKVYGF